MNHRAREHGKSKYGLERYVRGAIDLLTVMTITIGAGLLTLAGDQLTSILRSALNSVQ